MKLLLAEDEKELSKALCRVLNKKGYLVDAVFNGQEVLDFLQSSNYDALILDIMMPIKDGFDVLKTLRAQNNKIPVLILTAKSSLEDKVQGLDLGADDYLTKPFASEELIARIRAVTRRKAENKVTNNLSYKDFTLDRTVFELIGKTAKIPLRNHEFQIIETLMTNKDMYFSIDRLFEKIWGYESDTEAAVVWVDISNIRKKLRRCGSNVTIRGKRNLGYRLEESN